MKTIIPMPQQASAWLAVATGTLLVCSVTAGPPPPTPPSPPAQPRAVTVAVEQAEKVDEDAPRSGAGTKRKLWIESVERSHGKESAKEVTWLGVYTEEASEALGSQLGLKSGEGLLVTYVAADSPAAKAGLQKNDVLVEL